MSQVVYKAYIIVEVISAQQVHMAQILLIWTRLSLLITSHASIFSGLSPFILKEKNNSLHICHSFFLVLCVIIYFVFIFIFITTKTMLSYTLLICTRFLKNQFGKIKFDKLGFSLFQTVFLLTV